MREFDTSWINIVDHMVSSRRDASSVNNKERKYTNVVHMKWPNDKYLTRTRALIQCDRYCAEDMQRTARKWCSYRFNFVSCSITLLACHCYCFAKSQWNMIIRFRSCSMARHYYMHCGRSVHSSWIGQCVCIKIQNALGPVHLFSHICLITVVTGRCLAFFPHCFSIFLSFNRSFFSVIRCHTADCSAFRRCANVLPML